MRQSYVIGKPGERIRQIFVKARPGEIDAQLFEGEVAVATDRPGAGSIAADGTFQPDDDS